VKVIDNNKDRNVHTSCSGYTYVKPAAATKINVLQITSGNYSLAQDEKYKKLFAELKDNSINAYDINVITRTITQLNGYSSADDIKTNLYDANNINMLILGFGDCYGVSDGGGLNSIAAKSVTDFIADGKAVLFTHDTTSFCNVENASFYGTYWGYGFNTIIRDAVGLDRYGVSSAEYGGVKWRTGKDTSGMTANNYTGFDSLSDTQKEAFTDKYTVAYTPKTTTGAKEKYTQGYTNFEIVRWNKSKYGKLPTAETDYVKYAYDGDNNVTTSVSQVNRGQITTFPFNINTTDFDTSNTAIGKTLTVALTHDQYYQLNMNDNKVVVWYCLSGGIFNLTKNDGVNAYYIYNKGNVTYSGAGHQPGSVTNDEAKLFVNTMIAAYRAAAVSPSVSFESSSGETVQNQFIPVEYGKADENNEVHDVALDSDNSRVYFKISDDNLSAEKQIDIQFYYKYGDQTAVVANNKADLESESKSETTAKYTLGFTRLSSLCICGTRRSVIDNLTGNCFHTDRQGTLLWNKLR
jgi:hypothetical protein